MPNNRKKNANANNAKQPTKIGVGIIGGGNIARGVHIPGYRKLPDVEIIAVSDPAPAIGNIVREQFGIESFYSGYREMLKRDDIHVVSIATPNVLHAQASIDALNAGKHVLCEKPLAMNAKEGAKMVEAAHRNDRKLMCGYNFRFRPAVQTLKKFADTGFLGKPYYARVQALRRRGVPSQGVFVSKEKNGGGPLIDIGVHMLDAALHVLGFPKPIAVSGQTYQEFGKRSDVIGLYGEWDYKNFTVEDFAVAQIRFETGLTLSIETSFCANVEPRDLMTFQILGDKGGCELSPLKMYTEQHRTLLDITPVHLPDGVQTHTAEIASFIDSIVNDTPVYTPAEEALQITRLVDAIYESSEKGCEVRL